MPSETPHSALSCRIAYNEYGGYCIPRSSEHRPAAQRVLAGEVWERDTIAYLTAHVGDGDVVHAGTYFGDFLPALAGACTAGAKVWAFEPNRESFRCASITVIINDLMNVELEHAAVGASEDTAALLTRGRMGRHLGGGSRIVPEPTEHTESVRVVSVDEMVPDDRNVSLVHLDVEGFERDALEGALRTLARCRPVLVLEAVPDDRRFETSVLGLGYAVRGTVDTNTILACEPI